MGFLKKLTASEDDPEAKERLKQMEQNLQERVPQYKPNWNKGGVIQYKDENCAVLHRSLGKQVEFLIAFSDLSKEGYILVATDDVKSGGGGSFSGGVDSYYYFQNKVVMQ